MTNHLFLPTASLDGLSIRPEYEEWLLNWLSQTEKDIENGEVASSMCLQGVIVETVLFGETRLDWLAILDDLLTDENGIPLAYSEKYGKRLCEFNQWRQTPVHAIHTRHWIETALEKQDPDIDFYAQLIASFIQPSGWIYNPKVSETNLRTRMKSEYSMSLAMGLEIMAEAGELNQYQKRFEATLASTPITGFLSAEYFRIKALELMSASHFVPTGIADVLTSCETDIGYCDFAIKNKVDDYMGTAKRTSRDKVTHSPLSALHAQHISRYCDTLAQVRVEVVLKSLKDHMDKNPFDIQAFKIRDLPIPFGIDITPLELIAAAVITQ
jgi:hypothetical protein